VFDGQLELEEVGARNAFAVDLDGLEGFVLDENLEGLCFADGQLGLDNEFFKGGDPIDPPVDDLQPRVVGGGDGSGDPGEMVFWEVGGG